MPMVWNSLAGIEHVVACILVTEEAYNASQGSAGQNGTSHRRIHLLRLLGFADPSA